MKTRVLAQPERVFRVNGIELCAQVLGSAADPALLLIGGAASSMDWWEDGFCERLAAGGRRVIRYDQRDTGRSTHDAPGAPTYTPADLIADAVALLDALEVQRAHIAGISMGGGIAMRIALDHPERVASLTLLSTSPGGPGESDLPPMSPALVASFAESAPKPDWRDREAAVAYIVASLRPFAGGLGVDEAHMREVVGRVVDRTRDIEASMTNHWILGGGGEPVRPRLRQLHMPTLVLHGTDDPLFPYGHAQALAREIPGARLLPLPGVGHEMPPPGVWDAVVPAMLEHTAAR